MNASTSKTLAKVDSESPKEHQGGKDLVLTEDFSGMDFDAEKESQESSHERKNGKR